MKMNFSKMLLLVACFCASASATQAQKIGYMNSAAILASMPEVKQADANLDALQKQLQKKGQGMVEVLQKKYEELAAKEKAGQIQRPQLEVEAKKLKEEEGKIGQFEQDMAKQVSQKRETLLQPILARVNKAIEDISKEKGYNFVFDSSVPVLLYADESADVSDLVRKKLGLAAAPAATKPSVGGKK